MAKRHDINRIFIKFWGRIVVTYWQNKSEHDVSCTSCSFDLKLINKKITLRCEYFNSMTKHRRNRCITTSHSTRTHYADNNVTLLYVFCVARYEGTRYGLRSSFNFLWSGTIPQSDYRGGESVTLVSPIGWSVGTISVPNPICSICIRGHRFCPVMTFKRKTF